MVEVCRGITKHHYLVTDISDLPRVMKEAFYIAASGRPGPVLIDLPKDVQLSDVTDVNLDPAMDCLAMSRRRHRSQVRRFARLRLRLSWRDGR